MLAGLFGSAFVPTAYGASTTTVTFTAAGSNEDYNDTTAKTAYFATTAYPVAVFTHTTALVADGGSFSIAVSGGTIRSCVPSVTGSGNAVAATVTGTTQCSTTMTSAAVAGTLVWTMTLNKLSAGAVATITIEDPDGDSLTIAAANKLAGRAATALSTVPSATESLKLFGLTSDGNGTLGDTADVADEVIGGVNYFLPTQPLKKAVFAGTLANADGGPIAAVTGLIATISNTTFTVNCDSTPSGAVTSTGAAETVAVSTTITTGVYECAVFSDGAESAGGTWTITVKVATTGLVVGTASGGFYGQVASTTAAFVGGSIIQSNAAADIDDFIVLTAKDAAGRAYGTAEVANLDFTGTGTISGATSAVTNLVVADGTTVATKGYHKVDNALCPTGSAGATATVAAVTVNGSAASITSNQLTVNCGAVLAGALTISKIEYSKSNPVPGETFDVYVYMVDALGNAAGAPAVDTADFTLNLTGATETSALWDGTTFVVTAAGNKHDGKGRLTMGVKAPATVGTAITVSDPTSSAIAKVYTTNDAYAGVLSVGAKKLKATADFGPAAASKKVAFVLESASGTTKTYYRKANASGVASYTLALRGTWTVYATFGDEISGTGTMKK